MRATTGCYGRTSYGDHTDCTPTTHLGDPLGQIECNTAAYLRTPEGRAEVEKLAAELRGEAPSGCVEVLLDRTCGGDLSAGRREVMEIAQQLLRESAHMEQTTEGISRADVEDAMAILGIFNPKPEIPLEQTLSGHEIVGIARRFRAMEARLAALEAQTPNATH